MKYVAVRDGRYACYLSDNGRDARYLGCSHAKPREATRHTNGTFVDPARSVSGTPYPPRRGAQAVSVDVPFSEASDSPSPVPASLGPSPRPRP